MNKKSNNYIFPILIIALLLLGIYMTMNNHLSLDREGIIFAQQAPGNITEIKIIEGEGDEITVQYCTEDACSKQTFKKSDFKDQSRIDDLREIMRELRKLNIPKDDPDSTDDRINLFTIANDGLAKLLEDRKEFFKEKIKKAGDPSTPSQGISFKDYLKEKYTDASGNRFYEKFPNNINQFAYLTQDDIVTLKAIYPGYSIFLSKIYILKPSARSGSVLLPPDNLVEPSSFDKIKEIYNKHKKEWEKLGGAKSQPKPQPKPPVKPKPTAPVDPDKLTPGLDHEQPTKPATLKVSQYHDFEKNQPPYFEYKNYSQQNLGYFHSVWGKFTHPKNKEERWLLYITLEKLAELSSGKVIAVTVTQPSECKPCRLELIKPSVTGPFITPEQAQRIGVIIRELRIPAHIKVRFINGKLEVVK